MAVPLERPSLRNLWENTSVSARLCVSNQWDILLGGGGQFRDGCRSYWTIVLHNREPRIDAREREHRVPSQLALEGGDSCLTARADSNT